ncbi:hypothetical protein BDR06DRAFT_360237 [Suillus hirtellus]|nr:hypothetical protein BDR06DRAFT_360237 [Suillus hirtellus]
MTLLRPFFYSGFISLDLGKLYLPRLVYILGGMLFAHFSRYKVFDSTSSGVLHVSRSLQQMWRYMIRLATPRNLLVHVQSPHDQRSFKVLHACVA